MSNIVADFNNTIQSLSADTCDADVLVYYSKLQRLMEELDSYWSDRYSNLKLQLDDSSQIISAIHGELHEVMEENKRLRNLLSKTSDDAVRYQKLIDHFLSIEDHPCSCAESKR